MKTSIIFTERIQQFSLMVLIVFSVLFVSCSQEEPTLAFDEERLMQEMSEYLDMINRNNIKTREHGYLAKAVGSGVIHSGEYAGSHFVIGYSGLYSDVGSQTLISGTARINIRGDKFQSVENPLLQSFCCGEGDLTFDGDEYTFTLFGQVQHTTEVGLHNHLFAGLGSTSGYFNLNILDQSGTAVDMASPPHNPGIGLLTDLPSRNVRVREH